MTVLDQIAKLEEQKQALLQGAHDELLAKVEATLAELNALGFKYKLAGTTKSTGKRRSGVRQEVLETIKQEPNGIERQELLNTLGATGDKKATQSISNAISALKKSGAITADGGVYKVK